MSEKARPRAAGGEDEARTALRKGPEGRQGGRASPASGFIGSETRAASACGCESHAVRPLAGAPRAPSTAPVQHPERRRLRDVDEAASNRPRTLSLAALGGLEGLAFHSLTRLFFP